MLSNIPTRLSCNKALLLCSTSSSIPAGFPNPSQDYEQTQIDLNEVLIHDRAQTYILNVSGDSMTGVGICDGDQIIVDRSIAPQDGMVVVAALYGEYTVKRFKVDSRNRGWLVPENPAYPPLEIEEGAEFSIFGVVTRCLHKLV